MKSKSTLTAIAEKAGVSIATVSRILNDTGRVSSATRHKVLQAMRELEQDSSLRHPGQFYQRILVLVPDFFNPFYASFTRAVSFCFNRDLFFFQITTATAI
jgi:DNA-binding LacI/PurR family transcriptional regulator